MKKQDDSGSVESHRYLVRYPSGKQFIVHGRFVLAPVNSWLLPSVFQEGNEAVILDQRAIVECEGVEVYSPRRNRDGLYPEMSKWLDHNPEWAS